jgi:hypothetical protein
MVHQGVAVFHKQGGEFHLFPLVKLRQRLFPGRLTDVANVNVLPLCTFSQQSGLLVVQQAAAVHGALENHVYKRIAKHHFARACI